MPGKIGKRQVEMRMSPDCPYSTKKLFRSAFPLPPLTSIGALHPVHSIILRSVMGGCEIVDYANNVERTEERVVVDLSTIGQNFPQSGLVGASDNDSLRFQQQSVIENIDQLISGDASIDIKEDLCMMETQKTTNDNSVGIGGNNNYEYANLIEGMINNVLESANNIKSMENENNNNTNENNFEFFNYDSSQMTELTTNASAPVIINLQNYYDPINTSQARSQIDHFHASPSMDCTESSSSPGSTIEIGNEQTQYCNLDTYKMYQENTEVVDFSGVNSVQSEHVDLGVRNLDTLDTFFEFDSIDQRLVSHTSMSVTSLAVKEKAGQTASFTTRKRKKYERRIQSNWDKGKRISCSLCSKMFRTAAHLKTHFVVHSMSEVLKPSRCVICNKGFCHRGALTLHMRAHASKVTSTSQPRDQEY